MVEEEEEGRRMEANLLATESTLLITHAQVKFRDSEFLLHKDGISLG